MLDFSNPIIARHIEHWLDFMGHTERNPCIWADDVVVFDFLDSVLLYNEENIYE